MISRHPWNLRNVIRGPQPAAAFSLLSVSVSYVDDTSIQITWTMSEVSSGQIEYGATAGLGSTTTLQSIDGGYSRHIQSVTGLTAGQTIYYRTVSENADGVTVYSAIGTATTSSTSATTAGPRATPALPATYVVVPSSVASDGSDCSASMQAFLDSVPDGTTVVFDKTETGSGGTTYTMANGPRLRGRRNLTLWGYGAAFFMTRTDGNVLGSGFLIDMASENIKVLGFDIGGMNDPADLRNLRDIAESSMGVAIWTARNVTVQDCTLHNLGGDGIYVGGQSINPTGWSTIGPWDFSYNHIYRTARQGITHNYGAGHTIDYNLIEDIAMYPFDCEDHSDPTRVTSQVRIRHNEVRRWAWHTIARPPIAMSHAFTRGEILPIDYWEFSDNVIDEGWMSLGRPSVDSTYRSAWIILHASYEGDGVPVTDMVIERNTCTVDAELLYTAREKGAVWLEDKHNVTIRDNDFQGMKIVHVRSTGTVTISGNGASPVATSLDG